MSKQPMWREYPHLFANGRFLFEIRDKFTNLKLINHNVAKGRLTLSVLHNPIKINDDELCLLARPISDMTDEECGKYKEVIEDKQYSSNPEEWWKGGFEAKLYLLSIGVYPFDQSDFELDGLEAVTKETV